ncbi:hypothetical protein ATANTOWER_006325 [Ataeniobius toweri]|uniref:Uncharacterized protein n=1 Tax=Ataeniobius toweri TaxID=208326 RepID=A0ABU7C6N0_9TELE|nr:hypothetical protein [Ataeniobius toweri]
MIVNPHTTQNKQTKVQLSYTSIDGKSSGLKCHLQQSSSCAVQSKINTHCCTSCPLKTVRLRSPDHPPVQSLLDDGQIDFKPPPRLSVSPAPAIVVLNIFVVALRFF